MIPFEIFDLECSFLVCWCITAYSERTVQIRQYSISAKVSAKVSALPVLKNVQITIIAACTQLRFPFLANMLSFLNSALCCFS